MAGVVLRMLKIEPSFQGHRVHYLKPQSLVSEDVIFPYTWLKRNDLVVLTSGQKIGDWKLG